MTIKVTTCKQGGWCYMQGSAFKISVRCWTRQHLLKSAPPRVRVNYTVTITESSRLLFAHFLFSCTKTCKCRSNIFFSVVETFTQAVMECNQEHSKVSQVFVLFLGISIFFILLPLHYISEATFTQLHLLDNLLDTRYFASCLLYQPK